jgi:hypothetical protein
LEQLEDRTVPAMIVWDGGPTGQGTNWLDPANWVGDVLPGPNDDAVIGPAAPGQPTEITLTGNAAVHSATVTGVTLSLLNATFSGSLLNHGTIRTTSATVNGPLANDATITVAGDTTWNCPGDSTNSSMIDVIAGNLTLNQSAAATFGTTGTVTVGNGRTFAVNGGNYSQSAGKTTLYVGGTLAVAGNFSQTGGVLEVAVNGSMTGGTGSSGVITVTGGVTLGGSLAVPFVLFEVAPNVALRIIDHGGSDPVTGHFDGLPEGAPLTMPTERFRISYAAGTGNDVVLTRDPPATCVWDGGPTGKGTDWFDPVNWSGDFVPTFGDDVVIGPLAGGPTVVTLTASGSSYVRSVAVTGATLRLVGGSLVTQGDITNAGTIELTSSGSGAGAQLIAVGSITNAAGGVITTLTGAGGFRRLSSRVDNRGTITVGADTTWNNTGASTNAGTVDVSGGNLIVDAPSGATFGTSGLIKIAAGRSFTITGGTFTNFSNYTLSGGTYNLSGTFGFPGGIVGFPGALVGSLAADLTLDGPGAAVLDSSTSRNGLATLGTIAADGRLTLRNGGTPRLEILPMWGLTNFGTLTVGAGCSLGNITENPGIITGSGSFGLTNNDGGTVRPGEPVGTLTFNTDYVNAGGRYNARGTLEIDLNGTYPGSGYDQVIVNHNVFLGGKLIVKAGYAAAPGDRFVIIDNRGTQSVFGTFDGLPEGAVLIAGGQDFRISYAGGDGNDVTLTRTGPVLPQVLAVQVDAGTAQRSRVSSLTVSFNTAVSFAGPAADAFVLTRDGDAAPVAFTATASVTEGITVVTLGQFAGTATDAGSLADGRYTLTVRASQVSTPAGSLDGNRDGTPGDDYTFGAAQGLRRMYGDATGDGWVDTADLALFRETFGRIAGDPLYLSYLDANTDGAINGIDLARFRQAYMASPPRVAAVQFNDGSAQRSRITSLTVTFSTSVTFAGAPAAAFVLTREDGTPVTFTASVSVAGDATLVTLDHFAGAAVEAGSLADGRYTLKVLASQVSTPGGSLDGNGDGTTGDDYSFGAAHGLVRLYGDTNGDGKVDAADLALFRQTFGRVAGDPLYLSWLDVNGDGVVNGIDLARFRQAFGGGG